MYKIYINENILELKDAEDIKSGNHEKEAMLAPYGGKTKLLLSYVDMLEKTNKFKHVILYHKKLKVLWSDFKSLFEIIEAGGGIVRNEKKQVLFIYRKGVWDLPKGKKEKKEKKRVTAVREVEEETGIRNVSIHKKVIVTYHLYKLKTSKRAMKKTHWYAMSAVDQKLIPQTKEQITKADWKKPDFFYNKDVEIYNSIVEVIEKFMKKQNDLGFKL